MEKCMWCTTSLDVEGDAAIRSMLHRYSSEQLSEREMDSLNEDLSCCMECVVEYHRGRDKVPELHKVLWKMEKARLLHVLGAVLEQELEEDDDLFIIEDNHEEPVSKISPTEFQNSLRFPLFEVLKYPYLLCHRELCDLVVKALCMLEDMNQSLNVFEKYQGTYLMLVHPNEKVRRWAIDAAKSMKSVDRDAYYDLQEIFSCMFYVIELGISPDIPDLSPDSYAGGSVERLPSHLYDSHNKKNYWLGICMLLTQLSAEAMDSLFSSQLRIPQCILHTMDDATNENDPTSDPFWPALHCFMVILDRLGSKIWGQIDPNLAFQSITGAASYAAELKSIQQKTMGRRVKVEPECDDNMVTCSQMVYDCYASERTNQAFSSSTTGAICNNYVIYEDMQSLVNVLDSEMGQSMRVYGSTFLWFIPFVRSIMELPELNASYISEVIHYLCDKILDNRHMLIGQTNMCDKVTEFFIRILLQIVELHCSEGRMGILSRCAPKWVKVIVMCTVQSDEVWNAGTPDRMGGIHRVSSTSYTLGARKLSAPGGGVGAIMMGCITLIRLLLKEGIKTGSDRRSTSYLSLLNKQLRSVPVKQWNLTESQYQELCQCLVKIVQSIPERSASSPSIPSSTPPLEAPLNFKNATSNYQHKRDQEAGPSSAGDTPAFIKENPLRDCSSDEDFCCGLEDTVKIKKQPPDPVLVSELRPVVELARIKPDLEKLQEIRSRLNDNQNLSKIEAIAQRTSGKRDASNQVHLAEIKEECDSGDEVEDDEPLDIRRNRLLKSQKSELCASIEDHRVDAQKHSMPMYTSKEKSNTRIISDYEVWGNDQKPTKEKLRSNDEMCALNDTSPKSPFFPESPGRDYDDLSESQVFEFETQQYVASAWGDSDFDTSNKCKIDPALKLQVGSVPDVSSPSWSSETELVPDEDIERACQQAEEKIRQQHQQQEPCASSLSKETSLIENRDEFIKPKTPPVNNQKVTKCDKRDIKQPKRPLIIDALAHKVRRNPYKRSSSWDEQEPPSTSACSSGLPSSSSTSISSPYFMSTSRGIPAVVPPKKVRKAIEPESTAERLGLKKKERKAFDLSQNSLDSVAKLRGHGQRVQVEPQLTRRRVCRISKVSPQKRVKSNKKLLASQDMQFFRQSRDKHQRPAVTSPTAPTAPKPAKSCQQGEMHLSKSKGAEKDFNFLPCLQKEPDIQQNEKMAAKDINVETNHNVETYDTRGDIGGFNTTESKYFRNTDVASTAVHTEKSKTSEVAEDEVDDEWMFLTQREPTDMELCSQMEQFEEDEGLFLTQRDPVDMDLDTDDSARESNALGQQGSVAHKPLQTPHMSKTSDSNDNLFLRPGMSPISQKKAKPSTTKIYTPSSRSASLVQEMEKGDKPPLVAKAKVVRIASAMPPPRTTTTTTTTVQVMPPPRTTTAVQAMPPPRAATAVQTVAPPRTTTTVQAMAPPRTITAVQAMAPPRTTTTVQPTAPFKMPTVPSPQFRQPSKLVSSTKMNSEQPSYKTYQRPETPVHTQGHRVDLSILTQAILKWEYRMFDNYKTFGSPDDLCQLPLKEVPVKFSSYLEYFNTLYPLLLLNTFEEIANEWLKERRVNLLAKVQGMEYSDGTASANFTAFLSPESEKNQLYPKEDDLVLLWLPENLGAYTHEEPEFHEHPHFGYVSRSSVSNKGPGTSPTLNMTIQTRGNVSSVNAQPVRCEVIGSLISAFREFRALCSLRNGPMWRPLLAPHVSYFTHRQDIQLKMDTPEYNMEQSRAIAFGLATVKRTEKTPKLVLIHGPPGTGKSKTIVGLLHKLLSSSINSAVPARDFPSKARRTRVLLCAPSNAAIDSLMKKVIVVFKEKCRNINAPQGNCGDINLVRLGSERTISKSLKPFSLDHQTRARAQRAQQTVEADVQRQKEQLDQNIDVVSQHCAKAKKDSVEFKKLTEKKMQLLREREGLSRKIKECRGKRHESQALVLQNANVICCTLSTSGSSVLENAFRRLGHEPFSCVIIDEASQAKETETLIPMLYRCPAVVLVGDPNQLPPTVVSTKAKELGYDQSLMARLCKCLHQSNPQPSPIFLLSVQYRMHPDICEFPSKYIYNNALKNDWQGQCRQYDTEQKFSELRLLRFLRGPCECETAQKRCSFSWPFRPYRVFDVTDGREEKKGDSFINSKEVRLIKLLLKLLGEKQSVRVGVITPYNAQKRKILEATRELAVEKHLQVEVDTVDGFQGREMDCIIVSCVRASSEMGSIGFVGNRERMNVTITRAKFSLFILGHLRTLREQSDWGALIEDAGRRGTIIKTHERDFRSDAKKILKQDPLSRSLSHPPICRPSTVTSPVTHSPVDTPSTSRTHILQHQAPRLIPLDCPEDPRMADRPTDPRFTDRRLIGDQRQNVEGRGLSVSHQPVHRANSYDPDYRNTWHSSRYSSRHHHYSSPKQRRR